MDYIEDSKFEIMKFLQKEKIDLSLFNEETIDDMAYKFYKNYYDYEMDIDFSARAAVSEVLRDNNITIQDFSYWFP
jgi:hypothetical protein